MRLEEREGLKYTAKTKALFAMTIDETGGWPVWATHVVFRHGLGPFDCAFSDAPLHNEWWSIIMTASEYYWLKVSDEHKAKIRAEFRREFVGDIRSLV